MKIVRNALFAIGTLIAVSSTVALAQVQGGKLVIGRPSDAISLDPHRATTAPEVWVYNNIFETLVAMDENMEIVPSLATSWERIDETTMRFHLKEGVLFHDGTPFNAEAVKFTIDRAINPESPARGRAWIGPVSGATVVDDLTVDIHTATPFGPLLNHLSLVFVIGVVSPTAVELYGDTFGRSPVGTGPFKFESWETNQSITLVRNDDYHGAPAYLDEVEFRVIPEEGARQIAFIRGDLDVLLRAAPAELEAMRSDPTVQVMDADGLRVVYVGLNHGTPPTDNLLVRQAIVHAIDVDSINAFVVEGAMLPAKSVIATSVFGYKDTNMMEQYSYDPALSLELLVQAGYTKAADGKFYDAAGEPLTLVFWASQGRDLKDREISEAVLAQLTEIGLTIDYKQQEWGAYLSALATDDDSYNLITLGWVAMTGDSDFGLYNPFYSTVTASNYSKYNNPEVDRLLDLARVSLDQDVREAAYGEALELITADVVWQPIYQTRETVVAQSYVMGYVPHPAEYYIRLASVWLDR